MVVFVVVDRTIYLIVFANNPLMGSIALERFYAPSFSYHGLWESLEARLYNFWICYLNAAALWDAGVHRISIVIVVTSRPVVRSASAPHGCCHPPAASRVGTSRLERRTWRRVAVCCLQVDHVCADSVAVPGTRNPGRGRHRIP